MFFLVMFGSTVYVFVFFFFFQAEDGIRDLTVTGVQTCALPIFSSASRCVQSFSRVSCLSLLALARSPIWPAKVSSAFLCSWTMLYLYSSSARDRKSVV